MPSGASTAENIGQAEKDIVGAVDKRLKLPEQIPRHQRKAGRRIGHEREIFRAAGDVAVHKYLAFEKRQADELAVVLDFLRLGHADGGVRRGRRRHRVAAIRRGASDDEERGQRRAKCPKRCAHVIFHRPMIIHKERWPRNSEYACI